MKHYALGAEGGGGCSLYIETFYTPFFKPSCVAHEQHHKYASVENIIELLCLLAVKLVNFFWKSKFYKLYQVIDASQVKIL